MPLKPLNSDISAWGWWRGVVVSGVRYSQLFVQSRRFDPPHLPLAPPQGKVEFRDLWHQKTRVPGLSCGVVCVILRLAVLVELRLVTDRQTQTPARG